MWWHFIVIVLSHFSRRLLRIYGMKTILNSISVEFYINKTNKYYENNGDISFSK